MSDIKSDKALDYLLQGTSIFLMGIFLIYIAIEMSQTGRNNISPIAYILGIPVIIAGFITVIMGFIKSCWKYIEKWETVILLYIYIISFVEFAYDIQYFIDNKLYVLIVVMVLFLLLIMSICVYLIIKDKRINKIFTLLKKVLFTNIHLKFWHRRKVKCINCGFLSFRSGGYDDQNNICLGNNFSQCRNEKRMKFQLEKTYAYYSEDGENWDVMACYHQSVWYLWGYENSKQESEKATSILDESRNCPYYFLYHSGYEPMAHNELERDKNNRKMMLYVGLINAGAVVLAAILTFFSNES